MSVFLSEHHHIVSATLDGEISRFADGIEDGHLFIFDGILTWLCNFAHHGIMEVAETHGDGRILDKTCIHERFPYLFGNLLAGETSHLYLSHHREIDVALAIYSIVIGILRQIVGAASACFAHKIEELRDLRILALYSDIDLIGRLYGYHSVLQGNDCVRIIVQILKIGYILRGTARRSRKECYS